MPNAKVLEAKQDEVVKIKEQFQKAKLIILSDYRGINVADITEIRASLRNAKCEYKVVKNSILKFAIRDLNLEGLEEFLVGPTAITFSYDDYVAPAKILHDYAKDKDFYKIKAGIMDGKIVSADEIIKLAKLPSREVLLTKLATVLLANIRNVAVVLDQVRMQKEEA